ncbi:PTS system mannose/fructose/N-acetylgalactosamine-transporter subunit IIB [Enterococcus sp. CWB-B31]|uniref:PTS system mannose/fructose/N-acetylgalactosamine-transporter subunit IIB n=1 Tax=Enterococcus sp. CWB-B31 TaxID=2885159 RepID=UPI001E2A32C5|nr:PTS sugar transporter subunit IIB [Enterococcus sp. CWB-B31]MCB5953872.1 PTS sugar transporter subunit IIB [Enterococcus sp. CWB-B31]
MAISFIRIDDRIIHGQVVTRWMSERKCDGVVAVDDPSATNPVLAKMLKSAVPLPLKGFVMTEEEIIQKWSKIVESKRQYFLIARSPATLVRIFENGVNFISEIKELNVGPMSVREGAKKYGKNLSMIPEEEEAFDVLQKNGMTISFQLVPDSKRRTWDELKAEGGE